VDYTRDSKEHLGSETEREERFPFITMFDKFLLIALTYVNVSNSCVTSFNVYDTKACVSVATIPREGALNFDIVDINADP
jgi:hypothetical protein